MVRIGISSCLLGEQVRYDGGDKRDPYLADVLSKQVTWVPVCPEVEAGMSTPREPVDLMAGGRRLRMVGLASGMDYTVMMESWIERRLAELEEANLDGYVLKSGSPSCGIDDVRRRQPDGQLTRTGRGLFAAALMKRMPSLPVEDERRLQDPAARERFLGRVRAYHAAKARRRR